MTGTDRSLIIDGRHLTEITQVLERDLGSAGLAAAKTRAQRLLELSVDPIGGVPDQPSDGLLYGLIQSGKTSVLTVTAAMAADNAFQCILILTSDNDLLYDQTLERVRGGLRGLTILGKRDWRDAPRFARQLRTPPFGIVCSKNSTMLASLLDAFRHARARGLSVLIIDDEADQASLNTHMGALLQMFSSMFQNYNVTEDQKAVRAYLIYGRRAEFEGQRKKHDRWRGLQVPSGDVSVMTYDRLLSDERSSDSELIVCSYEDKAFYAKSALL